jgi:hypothetical protein
MLADHWDDLDFCRERLATLLDSLIQSPRRDGRPSLLGAAGPRLQDLRRRSGWTVEEISQRSGIPLLVLEAFENGDPMADHIKLSDLILLATLCCGTLADILDHTDGETVDGIHEAFAHLSPAIDPTG